MALRCFNVAGKKQIELTEEQKQEIKEALTCPTLPFNSMALLQNLQKACVATPSGGYLEMPMPRNPSIRTLWDVDSNASQEAKEGVEKVRNMLVEGCHATLFAQIRTEIEKILRGDFDTDLLRPLKVEGEHIAEMNFGYVYGKRQPDGSVIPSEPIINGKGQFWFPAPEDKFFAVTFPAEPHFDKKGNLDMPPMFLSTCAGEMSLTYFKFSLCYAVLIRDIIEKVPKDAILKGQGKESILTAAEICAKLATPNEKGWIFYSPGAECADPRIGAGFPLLMLLVDFFVKTNTFLPQKEIYKTRGALQCRSDDGTTKGASLMRKHYPYGKPGPPTKDPVFILEVKEHLPIIAMATGEVNRQVFGNYGEWPLQLPLPPQDFLRAWECWCPHGAEVSISFGLGGPSQVKFSYFQNALHLMPAFPLTFKENFTLQLQDLYKAGHVTELVSQDSIPTQLQKDAADVAASDFQMVD